MANASLYVLQYLVPQVTYSVHCFVSIRPIHGLIFLYKWKPGEEPQGSIVQDSRLRDIYFAKQVINNACATQAIISVLLNISHTDMELGSVLADFRDFSRAFDASVSCCSVIATSIFYNSSYDLYEAFMVYS